MSLTLKQVPAAQGAVWVRDGVRTFLKRPLAFTAIYALVLIAGTPLLLLPYVGVLLVVAVLPLMSMGYMIATRNVLQGAPVHPGHLIEPLMPKAPRRGTMLALCIAYAVCGLAIFRLGDWLDGGSWQQLQDIMASANADTGQMEAALADGRLLPGMLMRMLLMALASVPFWHAPALVHWGSQGMAQALFSSTVAVWRNRGAFVVYGLMWAAVVLGFSFALALLLGVLGMIGGAQVIGFFAGPIGLMLTAAFYVSLLFTFNDSFGANGHMSGDPAASPGP